MNPIRPTSPSSPRPIDDAAVTSPPSAATADQSRQGPLSARPSHLRTADTMPARSSTLPPADVAGTVGMTLTEIREDVQALGARPQLPPEELQTRALKLQARLDTLAQQITLSEYRDLANRLRDVFAGAQSPSERSPQEVALERLIRTPGQPHLDLVP